MKYTGSRVIVTLIILFFNFTFYFLFIPCGRLSWLPVSCLLHVKYTLSYRIVLCRDVARLSWQHQLMAWISRRSSLPASIRRNVPHFSLIGLSPRPLTASEALFWSPIRLIIVLFVGLLVSSRTTNTFKARLDKFWENQDVDHRKA